ncbi:MAG: site-specific DNA-methyltransferase [Salinispira sp.]
MNKINGKTMDIVAENIGKLKKLFPEAFSEGKVNFNTLKEMLGEFVDDADERYSFTWNGKSRARMLAQTPSAGTLRPCREDSVNWDRTRNMFIEGDNLEVLKLLQKSYYKKVKMIYIDPPYNTGKDFVYKDNFRDNIKNYKEITGQVDGEGRNISNNPETSGRYHTDWLNMMYPRLKLARNLLRDDGVIFMSIDDNEVANLRKICDEIFGEENFLSTLIWNKQHSQQQGLFKRYHEYVHVYAKNELVHENIPGGDGEIDAGALKKISKGNPESEFAFPAGVRIDTYEKVEFWGTYGDSEKVTVVSGRFVAENGKTIEPITLSAGWTQKEQMKKYFEDQDVYDTKGQKVLEFYFSKTGKLKCRKERSKITPKSLLPEYGMVSAQSKALKDLLGFVAFDNPKPVEMVKDFARWFLKDGILLDFFAGSATTAHAVMQLNAEDGGARKFIMVQLPETTDETSESYKAGYKTIAEISKERIRRAAAKIKKEHPNYEGDLGFKVFKLDSSNIKPWEMDFDMTEQYLDEQIENIKPGRCEEDLLYEILLKYGFDLMLPITEHTIAGRKVFDIAIGSLIICLSDDISLNVVEGIAKLKDELKPEFMRVVFRDSGFADDVVKSNTVQILETAGIANIESL